MSAHKLTTFLQEATEQMPGDRGSRLRLLGPSDGIRTVDLHLNLLNVESGPGPTHIHHRSDNVYIVLEGTLGVGVGEARYTAGPGDVLFIPAGEPHFAGNVGDTVAKLLEIYVPPIEMDGQRDFDIVAGGYDKTAD